MTDDDQSQLVGAWFDYVRRAGGTRAERKDLEMGEPADAARAADRVQEIVDAGGPSAVELIAALLQGAPDEKTLIAVAAGPLENLLAEHWDDVIEQVETLAQDGGPIRRALSSVHLTGEREARLRPWMK